MSFFDTVTNPAFKKDAQGRDLYFPYGITGKGRIVDTPEKFEELYSFQKRVMKITFIGFFGTMLLIGPIIPLLVLPFFALWQWRAVKARTNGLEISNDKLRLREAQGVMAKGLPMGLLVSILIFSTLGLIMSVALLFTEFSLLWSLFLVVVFGGMTFGYGRMIRDKKSAAQSVAG